MQAPDPASDLPNPVLPPPEQRIYVNRNLRMDTVVAIGFDMDYTLARYRREHLEALAHRLTIDKLVARGYPEAIRDITYDPSFVIRGLTVDKQNGNILKLDRHNHPARVFHGHKPLSKKERRELYRREHIHFVPPRFAVVDTLFSLPEVCLYSNLVDFFETRPHLHLDSWKLFEDTRECIDEAHRDNSIKSIVRQDLRTYVDKDPLLARTLHKLRSAGKKLFLLTNSYWDYTDTVMSYLLDDGLPEYTSWRSYFELIIVGSHKPGFFTGDAPLVEIDADGEVLRQPVHRLERGKIYQGGNLHDFETASHLAGEQILYVGDHIYGDILRSKKSSLWRTALVVEELESELSNLRSHANDEQRLRDLDTERRRLDELTNLQRLRLAALEKQLGPAEARTSPAFLALRNERDATKRALKQVIRELDRQRARLDKAFNKYWGMVFKEDHQNSRFGEQVSEYACIYTSRVSNFSYYSAYQYFRSPRDLMPHER